MLTSAQVKRGLCRGRTSEELSRLEEHRISLREDGRFDAWPLAGHGGLPCDPTASPLRGDEPVSMSLWGLAPRILGHLAEAVAPYELEGPDEEILIPNVAGSLVPARREGVDVVATASRCYGITRRGDVPLVGEHLEVAPRSARRTDPAPTGR